ncbi:MAG: STAS domain-containing protein [Candidatus Eremiobacteraeota bacterium]|nr:STAS domain-containing protein [Candidatus Eremiobacteraeota bacterium]
MAYKEVGEELAAGEMMLAMRKHDKVIVLEIMGDVDIHSAKYLGRELEKLICKEKHILLNLLKTCYMDSIGLSLLIAFHKKQREKGNFFGLCSPQSSMKRMLSIAKLYGFLLIFENEVDALCAFSEGH